MALGLSRKKLTINMILAIIGGAITFALFYYLPANLGNLTSSAVPPEARALTTGILQQLIPPSLTQLGLLLTVTVFLSTLLRGSKLYGLLVAVNGIVFTVYFNTLLQGGILTIKVSLPILPGAAAEGQVTLELPMLLNVFLIPPILSVVKGLLLIAISFKSSPKEAPPATEPKGEPSATKT